MSYLLLFFIHFLVIGFYFSFITITGINNNDIDFIKQVMAVFNYMNSCVTITISVIFAIWGYVMLIYVKKLSLTKWLKIKTRVYINIILMVVTFILRGASSFLIGCFQLDKVVVNDSVLNDNWIFPIYIVLWWTVEDVIPISIQIFLVRSVVLTKSTRNSTLLRNSINNQQKFNDISNKR